MTSPALDLAFATGRPVADVAPLGKNAYCSIWRAECGGEKLVFKTYRTPDARLPKLEAKAVDLYHSVAEGDDALLDSRCIAFSEERRLVAVGFVPGERLSDYLLRSRRDRSRRSAAPGLMETLGRLLRRIRERTVQPDARLDPFHAEYIRYCSKKLTEAPGVGGTLFRGAEEEAEALVRSLEADDVVASFAHGDFVFRNIHVHEGRIGLVDFANSLERSHTLNDVHNLRIALANMARLPEGYRRELWDAFESGLGPVGTSRTVERFFREYHRRRWLMLNLRCSNPSRWMRAARGMATFARAEQAR